MIYKLDIVFFLLIVARCILLDMYYYFNIAFSIFYVRISIYVILCVVCVCVCVCLIVQD